MSSSDADEKEKRAFDGEDRVCSQKTGSVLKEQCVVQGGWGFWKWSVKYKRQENWTLSANEFGCCSLNKEKTSRNFELFHHKKYESFV